MGAQPAVTVRKEFGDAAARHALAALTGPYLPWGVGAMRPAGLVEVCNDIVLRERRRIVELGGGVSTVLLARLLAQGCPGSDPDSDPDADRRLITVEHDAVWARWLTGQLDREGLGRFARVVHAPLAPHERAIGGLSWYDADALEAGLDAALRGDPIDLLVVDGPPAWARGFELARYPALPVLRDRLAAGATIVLDDVDRAGERRVLRRWAEETGTVFARRSPHTGIALAGWRHP